MVRYERRRQRLPSRECKEAPESIRFWRKKKQGQGHDNKIQAVRVSQESQSHMKLLQGQVNTEFAEWLDWSLVCTTDEPRDDSNNEVPGFEDLHDELVADNKVEQSNLRNHLVINELDDGVAKETPGPRQSPLLKMATQEILKLSQHLQPLGITTESEEQPPPGFENQEKSHNNDLDVDATPKVLENEDAQLEEG
ncbi:hypothetical protein Cgig2_009680 [Carnegiea gigantea]|uniref:Uncharacterized protein n=1 Tax=Carnegiea gigantea TaxID=171969 RepID=A0A9Q1QE46_9CARY|nr:hypothetical protein Cgig2_009680 [Carnegiea gigantea]